MTISIPPSTIATNQIFGDFIEKLPPSKEYLILRLSPSSVSLKQGWQNICLSADFLADYLTTFFHTSEDDARATFRQAEIKSSVSYIANELLENALKFNNNALSYPISIQIHLYNKKIVFLATNTINSQTLENFKSYINQLMTLDPTELYIQQLEKNAEDETINKSGIGLLTLINDYRAKLGWKFEIVQKEPEVNSQSLISVDIAATTMVQLTL